MKAMKLSLPGPAAAPSDGWDARGYIRFGLFCVLLLAGGLFGWGATAKLKGAVISSGHLRVESQRQVVQHPDGGVVGEILVREGDLVDAGQILVRLDGTTLLSELAVQESQLYELMARRGRLEAEQTDSETISFDEELLAAAANPEVQKLITGQQSLFEARLKTMGREIEVLQERQIQIREQITGSEAEVDALTHQSALIEQELEGQRKLLEQGLAQASRVLALERESARLAGERGQKVAQTAQLKGQISEIEIELLKMRAARREDAITKLRDLGFREYELKERRIALNEQLSRLDVRAPLDGVVLDMTVHALKSVVRPAEPILHIVPSGSEMVVDAQVDPIHVDSVHAGQEAVLRFSSFNSRTTPELFGGVVKISPDVFTDEATKRSYYRVEVALRAGELAKLKGQALIAGMPVEVFIQTGERTPLNYLVKPIEDFITRAAREE
jgi:HlyD family secretion protein